MHRSEFLSNVKSGGQRPCSASMRQEGWGGARGGAQVVWPGHLPRAAGRVARRHRPRLRLRHRSAPLPRPPAPPPPPPAPPGAPPPPAGRAVCPFAAGPRRSRSARAAAAAAVGDAGGAGGGGSSSVVDSDTAAATPQHHRTTAPSRSMSLNRPAGTGRAGLLGAGGGDLAPLAGVRDRGRGGGSGPGAGARLLPHDGAGRADGPLRRPRRRGPPRPRRRRHALGRHSRGPAARRGPPPPLTPARRSRRVPVDGAAGPLPAIVFRPPTRRAAGLQPRNLGGRGDDALGLSVDPAEVDQRGLVQPLNPPPPPPAHKHPRKKWVGRLAYGAAATRRAVPCTLLVTDHGYQMRTGSEAC
jgi:hypothetical protein